MLIMLALPGIIVKLSHSVQVEKMKKVSCELSMRLC